MKILIYGAGVIGSVYAAKLHDTGCDVTILARGERYDALAKNGVIIRNKSTGLELIAHLPVTKQLLPSDFYDLIIVTVRLDQIGTVIPSLQNNSVCQSVLFLLNNPEGLDMFSRGRTWKHILLGFPGVGGTYRNEAIDYILIKEQKTTLGDLKGELSVQLSTIKSLFEIAGFDVSISKNMPAWLKVHTVFIACVSAAIMKENGDSIQLGKNRSSVQIMVRSIHEGFVACKNLGLPIAPFNLKIIFLIMPQWFSVFYWQKALQGEIGTLAIAPHANAAKNEMQLLAKKVLALVHSSDFITPTLDNLLSSFIRDE
jgi:2-dehydropantoate 2-reductase